MEVPLILALTATVTAFAGDPIDKKIVTSPEDDRWKFTLAVPGWMAGVSGDVGIGSSVGNVNVGFDKILPKLLGNTVSLATVLFFAATAERFDQRHVRWASLAFAVALLLFAAVRMVMRR